MPKLTKEEEDQIVQKLEGIIQNLKGAPEENWINTIFESVKTMMIKYGPHAMEKDFLTKYKQAPKTGMQFKAQKVSLQQLVKNKVQSPEKSLDKMAILQYLQVPVPVKGKVAPFPAEQSYSRSELDRISNVLKILCGKGKVLSTGRMVDILGLIDQGMRKPAQITNGQIAEWYTELQGCVEEILGTMEVQNSPAIRSELEQLRDQMEDVRQGKEVLPMNDQWVSLQATLGFMDLTAANLEERIQRRQELEKSPEMQLLQKENAVRKLLRRARELQGEYPLDVKQFQLREEIETALREEITVMEQQGMLHGDIDVLMDALKDEWPAMYLGQAIAIHKWKEQIDECLKEPGESGFSEECLAKLQELSQHLGQAGHVFNTSMQRDAFFEKVQSLREELMTLQPDPLSNDETKERHKTLVNYGIPEETEFSKLDEFFSDMRIKQLGNEAEKWPANLRKEMLSIAELEKKLNKIITQTLPIIESKYTFRRQLMEFVSDLRPIISAQGRRELLSDPVAGSEKLRKLRYHLYDLPMLCDEIKQARDMESLQGGGPLTQNPEIVKQFELIIATMGNGTPGYKGIDALDAELGDLKGFRDPVDALHLDKDTLLILGQVFGQVSEILGDTPEDAESSRSRYERKVKDAEADAGYRNSSGAGYPAQGRERFLHNKEDKIAILEDLAEVNRRMIRYAEEHPNLKEEDPLRYFQLMSFKQVLERTFRGETITSDHMQCPALLPAIAMGGKFLRSDAQPGAGRESYFLKALTLSMELQEVGEKLSSYPDDMERETQLRQEARRLSREILQARRKCLEELGKEDSLERQELAGILKPEIVASKMGGEFLVDLAAQIHRDERLDIVLNSGWPVSLYSLLNKLLETRELVDHLAQKNYFNAYPREKEMLLQMQDLLADVEHVFETDERAVDFRLQLLELRKRMASIPPHHLPEIETQTFKKLMDLAPANTVSEELPEDISFELFRLENVVSQKEMKLEQNIPLILQDPGKSKTLGDLGRMLWDADRFFYWNSADYTTLAQNMVAFDNLRKVYQAELQKPQGGQGEAFQDPQKVQRYYNGMQRLLRESAPVAKRYVEAKFAQNKDRGSAHGIKRLNSALSIYGILDPVGARKLAMEHGSRFQDLDRRTAAQRGDGFGLDQLILETTEYAAGNQNQEQIRSDIREIESSKTAFENAVEDMLRPYVETRKKNAACRLPSVNEGDGLLSDREAGLLDAVLKGELETTRVKAGSVKMDEKLLAIKLSAKLNNFGYRMRDLGKNPQHAQEHCPWLSDDVLKEAKIMAQVLELIERVPGLRNNGAVTPENLGRVKAMGEMVKLYEKKMAADLDMKRAVVNGRELNFAQKKTAIASRVNYELIRELSEADPSREMPPAIFSLKDGLFVLESKFAKMADDDLVESLASKDTKFLEGQKGQAIVRKVADSIKVEAVREQLKQKNAEMRDHTLEAQLTAQTAQLSQRQPQNQQPQNQQPQNQQVQNP